MFSVTFFTLLIAALGTVLAVLVLSDVSGRTGLTDRPDARKSHEGEIPLIGGIAIFLSFVMCMIFAGMAIETRYFLLAGAILVAVGAVDDSTELSPVIRLVLHLVVALIMCIPGGVAVESLGELIAPGNEVTLGILAVPFTVFAVVALINAVNMSDGLDGLAGTQTLIPLAALAVIAGLAGDTGHFVPLVALCGGLVGFLFFNLRTRWRKKATIFLGDAGSSFLGFTLAWFLIDMSQGPDATIKPVSVLWFAMLPTYSTVEIVFRRLLRNRSPFQPDREHLHHVFILAGFSVSETVVTLAVITLAGVMVGVAGSLLDFRENIMFAMFVMFGLMFLYKILRTWRVMRFLQRSICRRSGDRRHQASSNYTGKERRTGGDRRRERRAHASK